VTPPSTERSGAGPSLPDKVVIIDEALVAAKVPHAIGGALALAYYAEPRATIDIDLNLFVPTEQWEGAADALVSSGVSAGELEPSTLLRDGQCRLWWGENPIDLFFANAPIHDAMRSEVRKVPFAGTTIPILGPEHLAVCKAMFDRPKDWLDIEQMLLGTAGLDISEIEQWLTRMIGKDDPRLQRLRDLQVSPPS
jgi:hypothetical protein